MCGIAGIYKFGGGEIKEQDLTRMRDTLAHRGPDGAKNFISRGRTAGLSQRRLAIIDLHPEAACPMPNEDESIWITFNGEIYNFEELRADLAAKGHTFRSHGDTEAILHGYEEYGTDIVRKLNGMFAFVIWDEKRQVLFAARDHIGIKPFYYAVQNGAFYFGSEIKAILAHPDFRKELNEPMIGQYLVFSAMPAPFTLFKDVQKLSAAHALTMDSSGTLKTWEYWNPLQPKHAIPSGKPENFYVEATRNLLKDSIRMQMVSDVPFGCFLSGGIDSSLNAALMSQALGKPVETFSIGTVNAEKYNEFEFSRLMAEQLGAKSHERVVMFQALLDFLPQFGKFADDPVGDQTCFLVYYLAELVRQSGVTVVQTGEGGDELFAGYGTYRKAMELYPFWQKFAMLPGGAKKFLAAAAQNLPISDFSKEYAARFGRGQEPFWGHAIAFSPTQKLELLSSRLQNDSRWFASHAVVARYYADVAEYAPRTDFLNRIGYLELKMRLADFLLMRVDKMAMAHSIEARVPFLDHRLVELALHIPQSIKIKNGELKHVLKRVAAGNVPPEIIRRRKQGFGAPVEEWLRGKETSRPLLDKIFNSRLMKRDIFNEDYIRALAGRHAGGENHTFRLLNLLSLSLWYDAWF